jgi:hypothetical protein
MHIFGITGPIGHGKTTFANALMQLEHPAVHMESSIIISEVANEWLATFPRELLLEAVDYKVLNTWLNNLATVTTHQLRRVEPDLLTVTEQDVQHHPELTQKLFMYLDLMRQGVVAMGETITEENKDRHRAMLQFLGGFLVARVDRGIWYDEIEQRIKKAEADGIKLYIVGGIRYPYDAEVVKRNGGTLVKLIRKDLPMREVDDVTERERGKIRVDTTVVSDATPNALGELAKALWQDYLLGDLLVEYNSNDFQPIVS